MKFILLNIIQIIGFYKAALDFKWLLINEIKKSFFGMKFAQSEEMLSITYFKPPYLGGESARQEDKKKARFFLGVWLLSCNEGTKNTQEGY